MRNFIHVINARLSYKFESIRNLFSKFIPAYGMPSLLYPYRKGISLSYGK